LLNHKFLEMKKLALVGIILPMMLSVHAQNDFDVLQASKSGYGGTARFQSMGGAFGSLGGDFSSISVNPAGLGVYRSAELSITPSLYYNDTESNYMGSTTSDFVYNFNINNVGYVGHVDLGKSGWVSFNFGVGFSRQSNYYQNQFISTNNATGSLLEEFTLNAEGDIGNYYFEGMALSTGAIFYKDIATGDVVGAMDVTDDEIQDLPVYEDFKYSNDFYHYSELDDNDLIFGQPLDQDSRSTGKRSEFVISAAGNYNHKIYIGASVGIQRFRYENEFDHYETTSGSAFAQTYPTDIYFDNFNFSTTTNTYGTGFNFKAGLIARPVDFLRIGASIHTPTIFNLESEFYSQMTTELTNGDFFEDRTELLISEFKAITPLKATAGIALQASDMGLISFDYEFIDYSNMKFRLDDDRAYERAVNDDIGSNYKSTHNFRGGAEARFGPFFFRGGLSYYATPFEDIMDPDQLSDVISYSGGVGFRSGGFRLDFGYVRSETGSLFQPIQVQEIDLAETESVSNRFIATLAFRF